MRCKPAASVLRPRAHGQAGLFRPPRAPASLAALRAQLPQAAQLVSIIVPALWASCFVSELLLLGCFSQQGIHFMFPWFILLLAFYATKTSLALGHYSPRHPQGWCPHRPTNQGLFPGLPPE